MNEVQKSKNLFDENQEFKPSIIAIVGPPLHGKTTLGMEIAAKSNLDFFDLDQARAEAFGGRHVGQVLEPDEEFFVMLTSYEYMHEGIRENILKKK